MSDVVWLSVTSYCSEFGIIVSFLNNSIILLLLCRKKSKRLGSYKFLIATFSLSGMFYSVVEWFMRPLIHIYDDTTIIMQRKRFDYSRGIARGLFTTYCGCFATSFTLFAVHFIYRYLAVCNPKKLEYFKGFRFLYWLFGVLVTVVSWAMLSFFCFPESERTMKSFREVVTRFYNLNVNETDYLPCIFWMFDGDKEVLIPINMYGLVQHVVVMCISFSIVFYCGVHTAERMKTMTTVSERTRALQKQLFTALVVQTIIPTFFMYLPTAMILLFPLFKVNIGAYGNITIISAHLYPAIDPLVLILLISDFRNAVGEVLCCFIKLRETNRSSTAK